MSTNTQIDSSMIVLYLYFLQEWEQGLDNINDMSDIGDILKFNELICIYRGDSFKFARKYAKCGTKFRRSVDVCNDNFGIDWHKLGYKNSIRI
jgi:hypothetical protein